MRVQPGTRPPVLVLHVTGANRDREAAWACALAGGAPEIVHLNQLLGKERRLMDYRMLLLPGGFSYGDDLGAGKLWAVALRYRLGAELEGFIAAVVPVLGVCNGFQALLKAGLLPNPPGHGDFTAAGESPADAGVPPVLARARPEAASSAGAQRVTLTHNASGRFECRWVYLQADPASPCIFTAGITEPIYCPVAHGEGRFVARDPATLADLNRSGLVALRYAVPPGPEPDFAARACTREDASYPWNPNGSQEDIAGICSPSGTVLGLMPHPEDHILPGQDPRRARNIEGGLGLPLFRNGIRYAGEL